MFQQDGMYEHLLNIVSEGATVCFTNNPTQQLGNARLVGRMDELQKASGISVSMSGRRNG